MTKEPVKTGLVVGASLLVPLVSLLLPTGLVEIFCTEVTTFSYFDKVRQKIANEDGGFANKFCTDKVAQQSCS